MDARSSPWEEGTLTVAELGAAQVEADLPGVLNDLRVLGVALGPPGVHGPNTGLVLLGQLVKDTRGPLRSVLPVPLHGQPQVQGRSTNGTHPLSMW